MRMSDWSSDVCSSDLLAFPEEGEGIRVDSGVRPGDSVSVHYDPMIAKIAAWGQDRAAALARLLRALASTEVAGVVTIVRSAERSVGKRRFRTWKYLW